MKLWWRLTLAVAGLAVLLSGFALVDRAAAQGRGAAPTTGKKSGEAFKNVTTSTLKELSVDDFVATMGVMAAALGYDCADCHPGAGTDKADFVIDTIPQKRTARRMLEMVATINRTNFAGTQRVTCWTCHHGHEFPTTTIALDNLYSSPFMEDDDIVPPGVGGPSADQILDKYIQARGGAQRLAGLTSFVATGASLGYGGFGGDADFTIFATTFACGVGRNLSKLSASCWKSCIRDNRSSSYIIPSRTTIISSLKNGTITTATYRSSKFDYYIISILRKGKCSGYASCN